MVDDDRIVSFIDTAQLPACQRMLMDWGLDLRGRGGGAEWRKTLAHVVYVWAEITEVEKIFAGLRLVALFNCIANNIMMRLT